MIAWVAFWRWVEEVPARVKDDLVSELSSAR